MIFALVPDAAAKEVVDEVLAHLGDSAAYWVRSTFDDATLACFVEVALRDNSREAQLAAVGALMDVRIAHYDEFSLEFTLAREGDLSDEPSGSDSTTVWRA
ncbi:hypothetical protein [Sinomonas sp. P10A9]|uniref:AsnC-like helix-turn-helix protein n=1 Tax=Sinomonas puerhi TaxID=3238584 RepID=A0AB39KY95_9MICC